MLAARAPWSHTSAPLAAVGPPAAPSERVSWLHGHQYVCVSFYTHTHAHTHTQTNIGCSVRSQLQQSRAAAACPYVPCLAQLCRGGPMTSALCSATPRHRRREGCCSPPRVRSGRAGSSSTIPGCTPARIGRASTARLAIRCQLMYEARQKWRHGRTSFSHLIV